MKRLPLVLLFVAMVALAHAAPPYKRVALPNGLTVVAVEDRSSAVAAFHLGVRYDPAAIPAHRAGVAALSQQLLQVQLHELLKQEPWQDLGAIVRGTGAVLAVNTEIDYCEVRGKLTEGLLPQAMQLAGKTLFGHDAFTDEQLQLAREVLLAARQDKTSSVVENTYYCFARALYGRQSALARSVQGTPETLQAITPVDINAFRTTYMVPNNAVLTVIAPRRSGDLADLAALTFGECPASKSSVPVQSAPVPAASRASVSQQPQWHGVSLMVGVPAPSYGTPDFLKAQLVYTLLEGKGGRIEADQTLQGGLGVNRIMARENEPVPVTVLAPMAQPRPFVLLHMVMTPQQMELARQELLKQFLILQQEAPTAPELERAKQRLINSYARLALDRSDFAKSLSCYELYGGDLGQAWDAAQRVEAITGPEIVALAKQYFGVHAVGVLMPGDQ